MSQCSGRSATGLTGQESPSSLNSREPMWPRLSSLMILKMFMFHIGRTALGIKMFGNDVDTIHGPMEFQKVQEMLTRGKKAELVTPDAPYFRPGTELPIIRYSIVMQGAGMGDHICQMPAIIWNARNCPWMRCRVFCIKDLVPIFANILQEYPQYSVHALDHINELVEPGSLMRGAGITMNGVKYSQLANGTGGHLVDLGFQYFCNIFPPPPGADVFPKLTFADPPALPAGLFPKTYVVFTTGAISLNRTVPGHYWNPIIKHVQSKGLTPVFLGKSQCVKNMATNYPEGCNYKSGLDLRDKTSLLEAAWIMKNSAVTIGLDNGLIHLAALTDAPLICAYNMVEPEHRRPKRLDGKWAEIVLTREELACKGCQSHMKSMFPHTFIRCLYGDNACVHLIFDRNSKRWTDAIDEILSR
jgi:hypothetical protein